MTSKTSGFKPFTTAFPDFFFPEKSALFGNGFFRFPMSKGVMDVLTSLQKTFLHKFGGSPFQKSFYLTGGTALAAFYLQHRLSEDLDFFTDDPAEIRRVIPWLQETARALKLKLKILRQTGSFIDCFFESEGDEKLDVDFAQDAPFRLQKTRLLPEFQIYVDNLTDISCNKLSALFDRAEPKDFVDLYFLDREFRPFNQILEKARIKHVGLDDYWLAQALQRVQTVEKLPRMLKEVNLDELKSFFLEWARKLIEPRA